MRISLALLLLSVLVTGGRAQDASPPRRHIIDMHMHPGGPKPPYTRDSAVAYAKRVLAKLDSAGVVLAVVSGPEHRLDVYASLHSDRFLLAPVFPCPRGRDFAPGLPADSQPPGYCLKSHREFPDTAWLRQQFRSGRFQAMGELLNQYAGVPFDDPRMVPYYALAQEFDIPVAFHTSGSYPLTAQTCCPKFRLALGDPMGLEEVLVRFPRLRVQIMHGWPTDDLFSMLFQYPQLVVDLTPWPAIMPVAEFHTVLRKYKEAGFLERVMFGTDTGPEDIPRVVAAFTAAEFLTPAELDGILCGNAERFLRRTGVCSGSTAPRNGSGQ